MAVVYFLLSIVVVLFTLVLHFMRKRLTYWNNRGIPCTVPHPFMGNLKGFRKDRILNDLISDVYNKYKGSGPFCGIYFFSQPRALILDRQLAKQILIKDFNNFSDRGMFHNEKDDPLTGHLFALDGEKWKQMRHKLSPTFTSGKMKFMFPTIVKVGEHLVNVLSEKIEKDNIVEIMELLACFTTDVIGTCAFGIECNSLKNPNAEFRKMGRMALTKFRHNIAIIGLMASFPDLARKLHMRQTSEEVHQFFMRIVRETVELREKNNIKRNDFMDLLIELKNSKTLKTEDGKATKGLTVEELAAQSFVFFLAGFETSSTTMSFAMYELAKNQDVQDKLRKEVTEVLAKHNQEFTYECMKDMLYLRQVISEILRLYTVVGILSRKALRDYTIPGYPKYTIEKGVSVVIPSDCYHHDPDIYPEPEKFDPERFSPEMIATRDAIDWLPFGEGPRNCIGKRFGQMQTSIGIALLVKNFKFSICSQTHKKMKYDAKKFLLSPEGGIYLQVDKV